MRDSAETAVSECEGMSSIIIPYNNLESFKADKFVAVAVTHTL